MDPRQFFGQRTIQRCFTFFRDATATARRRSFSFLEPVEAIQSIFERHDRGDSAQQSQYSAHDATTQTDEQTRSSLQIVNHGLDGNAATQTEGQLKSPSQIHDMEEHVTAEAILVAPSRSDLEPGQDVAMEDAPIDHPALPVVSSRALRIMNEIRSRRRLMDTLADRSAKAAEGVGIADRCIILLTTQLQDESISIEQRASIEQEMTEAEAARDRQQKHMSSASADLTNEIRNLKSAQSDFLSTMERALSEADLLESVPTNGEATASDKQIYTYPEHGLLEEATSVISDGERERRVILEDLDIATEDIRELQERFDDRGTMYERQFQSYSQAVEAGDTDLTMDDFLKVYFGNMASLTRGLIQAEENYESALARARQMNLLGVDYDQESNFGSLSDGYPPSMEIELAESADVPRVDHWMDDVLLSKDFDLGDEVFERLPGERWDGNVPIVLDLESRGHDLLHLYGEDPDREDWDSKSTHSDSWSAVDTTRNKRRILRAREICGRDR
ncbi:hypothetical protein MMC13_002856 [Lambiella insularis]|nr:hypothetical protein [Lambiella insularis]